MLPDLPSELSACVLQRCAPADLARLSRCCRSLHNACNDDQLWKFLCARDFWFPTRITARTVGWKTLYSRLTSPALFTWGANGNSATLGRQTLGFQTLGRHTSVPYEVDEYEDEDEEGDDNGDEGGSLAYIPETLPGRISGLDAAECIVQVVVLGWGMLARTRKGAVFSWGRIAEGSRSHQNPTRLTNEHQRARQISGGRDFCILLSDDYKVYWAQSADEGIQLARTNGLSAGEMVVQVAGGWTHGLALTSQGRILQWSKAAQGAPKCIEPPDVGLDSLWAGVAGGEGFTVAITRGGNAYKWSTDREPLLTKVDEVSVRYTHVSAAFRNYALFSPPNPSMSRSSSSLGDRPVRVHSTADGSFRDISIPLNVATGDDRIIQIVFGDWHTAALTQNGRLFTWGGGGGGQLGHGSCANENEPRGVEALNSAGWFVFQISAAGWQTACLAVRTD
ncbi:regulator of chromosome condensation 1/beta-lactamase-inhibitor protein II [Geranomyces variabilis]|nr:regulator of chromosome condensation 1/beta-lactamase-inhibitor protein II [Geranomyces variabilis]KAJ3133095.1 hypothetical protein HDU90_006437 [Geranomyces variabilis]